MAQTVKTKGTTFSPDWHFQEAVAWRDTDLDAKTLKEWFNYILLGRQVDYRFQVLNRQGRATFIISCAGQEAAQIGVSWPLKPKHDWLAPDLRADPLCLRKGPTPRRRALHAHGHDAARPHAVGAREAGRPRLRWQADPWTLLGFAPQHHLRRVAGGGADGARRRHRLRAEDGWHRQGPHDLLRRRRGVGGR